MKLFIGLGNPEKQHSKNRHNFGFMVVDEIAKQLKASEYTEKFGGLYTKTSQTLLFKPLSYMNNSGIPAARIANFFKIPTSSIFVFYDDLDIALGKIKIKNGGSDGGHNGIKSLDSCLGKSYWRVRMGINHPKDKNMVSDYVLGNFTPEEAKLATETTIRIAQNIHLLIDDNKDLFLTNMAIIPHIPT